MGDLHLCSNTIGTNRIPEQFKRINQISKLNALGGMSKLELRLLEYFIGIRMLRINLEYFSIRISLFVSLYRILDRYVKYLNTRVLEWYSNYYSPEYLNPRGGQIYSYTKNFDKNSNPS